MTETLLLLELNEVNFEHLRTYAKLGDVPNLHRLMESHGVSETVSEQCYDHLEPWIQWVTAHTGLPYDAHRIFRLGDIVHHDIPQIWEQLENQGLRVGAISPMNAKNRTSNASFFVPDPWTHTKLTGGKVLRRLHAAVAQAVNDNAQARLTAGSAAWLIVGLLRYARASSYGRYSKLIGAIRGRPWAKAMFLDLLLTDIFIRETQRTRPQFASLFLNAAAHIQHHYMFNSLAYSGDQQNPEWYVPSEVDPVGDIYKLYDFMIGEIQRAFPESRLMIATGLRQDPYPKTTFYWRLKDHAGYLHKLGVPFTRVDPRMSRDFRVECASEKEAAEAERLLMSAKSDTGVALFSVDNRGCDLFVTLVWPDDVPKQFRYTVGGRIFDGLADDIAFVALKNGHHNGTGYFIDTGFEPGELPGRFSLQELPRLICDALSVKWTAAAHGALQAASGAS